MDAQKQRDYELAVESPAKAADELSRLRSELAQAQAERDAQQRSAKEWSDWYERERQRGDTYRARALALVEQAGKLRSSCDVGLQALRAAVDEALGQKARAEAAEREFNDMQIYQSLLHDDYKRMFLDMEAARRDLAALRAACAELTASLTGREKMYPSSHEALDKLAALLPKE